MTEYYKTKLQQGLEFQDFVAVKFAFLGIPITGFSSKKYQYKKGENLQGFEIKNDGSFRKTGNLWIEVEERTATDRPYVESGILRNDNTRFYVIGDYEGVFLIQKKVLKKFMTKFDIRENNMRTSKGFLLPVRYANEWFDYIPFKTDNQNGQ